MKPGKAIGRSVSYQPPSAGDGAGQQQRAGIVFQHGAAMNAVGVA
jgi:hypothetical protein